MIKASPSYDDSQHEWAIGLTAATTGLSILRQLQGTGQKWLVCLNPFPVQGGGYDITKVTFRIRDATDIIDYGILIRRILAESTPTTRGNVFWVNRTVGQGPGGADSDIVTISHRTKFESSHEDGKDGYELDASAYQPVQYLDMTSAQQSASTRIESIEVCDQLCVVFGDGNVGAAPDSPDPALPVLLGEHLPAELDRPLSWWLAGIPGNRFRANTDTANDEITAGYQRYCNDTPGNGDICDMWDILLMFHQGAEDLKDGVLPSDADRNKLIADMLDKLNAILRDLFDGEIDPQTVRDRNNRALLITMPPYLPDVTDDTSPDMNKQAFVQWSESLLGLAGTWRMPLYNPYFLAVNEDDYLESQSYLFTDAGAEDVARGAAVAYQTNRIGGEGLGIY